MNTLIARGSIALAALSMLGGAVQAQSYQAGATVPFTFHAGNKSMPAGQYRFANFNNMAVAKIGNTRGATSFVPTVVASENIGGKKGIIVFHRYGDVYFLSEIWDPSGNGTKLPISRSEREYRVGAKQVAAVSVAVPVRAD